jgi:penicillin-binding protein 2
VILPPSDPSTELRLSSKPPLQDDDTRFASGKIAFFQYAAVAIFLFLISGFWKLQVQNTGFYDERAQQNSIKSVPIIAPRGRLLDRDGRVIVDNHTSHSLLLARETLKNEHLAPIAQGLDLDYEDLVQRVARFRKQPKYVPVVIKEELTPADLAFVESHRDFFPEMFLIQSQRRLYPQDGMLAHLVGYTGEISEAELETPEMARYEPGSIVGKFGIESEYNSSLMGVDGQRQVIVDSSGQVRKELANKPAIPGKDLQLSIDLDLQAVAEWTMEGRKGAVVALDPRTGEVLAMVSRPAFDANKFAVGIKRKDWKVIMDDPDKPMLNRAIQAQLAPGSTFKPIMALAGLETGAIDEKYSVRCGGGASFYGRYFKCWQKGGHGSVALHSGIVHSCDVFFYNVGVRLGIDKIADYAEAMGLGRKSGIDLPNEASGTVPSEKWKLRTQRQKWYAGETVSVSIGQGALTVSPLQLARAIGGLAIGGVWNQPHLVKNASKLAQPLQRELKPEDVKAVIDGMYGVVNEGGTGVRARLPNVAVCGKTGSAQIVSNDYVKAQGGAHLDKRDNAWFVGFAPREAPEIVVVALFEHGEHGQLAAPIARDVIKAYFDKKYRMSQLLQQQEGLAGKVAGMVNLGLPGGQRGPALAAPPPPRLALAPPVVNAALMESEAPAPKKASATAPVLPAKRSEAKSFTEPDRK